MAREHVREFEQAYGADGEWVKLFHRAPGYLRTDLVRNRENPNRYLTIDYWESESTYAAFRSQFAKEFAALDAKCAAWTTSEKEIWKSQSTSQSRRS